MPKVTVEWSPEEVAAKNARGDFLKCMKCRACGDSAWWKPFHTTNYETGVIAQAVPESNPLENLPVHGTKGYSALCEQCWSKASPEERVRKVSEALSDAISGIRDVVLLGDEHGNFAPCPKDKVRFNRQVAQFMAERALILEAVRSEG